jgi:hypothetical protein
VPSNGLDGVDIQDAHDVVTGCDRAVVDEPLLAVDEPGEVDPGLWVEVELRFALLGDQDGEGGGAITSR